MNMTATVYLFGEEANLRRVKKTPQLFQWMSSSKELWKNIGNVNLQKINLILKFWKNFQGMKAKISMNICDKYYITFL